MGNFVEPFVGSCAALLGRPHAPNIETVNDIDGFVANFWRALQADPDGVAEYADAPVNECDLHAKHLWLVDRRNDLAKRLMADPDCYDVKIAGWWVWGICCWIGSGWCSGDGAWHSVDGKLQKVSDGDIGVTRKIPCIGNSGRGVNKASLRGIGVSGQLPHLSNSGMGVNKASLRGIGVSRRLPHINNAGRGVNKASLRGIGVKRQLPYLSYHGKGVTQLTKRDGLQAWMRELADRLRHVRICCGDWTRVVGPSVTEISGVNGVFLDPPYAQDIGRDMVYNHESNVSDAVREWAIANGDNPKLRIVLCGYEDEHEIPDSWRVVAWKTTGGMSSHGTRGEANSHRERLWLSPHCLNVDTQQMDLF